MNMTKLIISCIAACLLCAGCSNPRQEVTDAHARGYDLGYADGVVAGMQIGVRDFITSRTPTMWIDGFNGEPQKSWKPGMWIQLAPGDPLPCPPNPKAKLEVGER